MSPTAIEEAGAAVGLGARILGWLRRPFAAVARRLGGVDVESEKYEIESRTLARSHQLKECDDLDACVDKVEKIGPRIERGLSPDHPDATDYAAAKHRLRELHPELPALCDATMRAISAPPEWQKIAQLARPAIAARRAAALTAKKKG
ncbi:MAG: hypothetical protein AABM40_04270 [Chloroflexota bacterium]